VRYEFCRVYMNLPIDAARKAVTPRQSPPVFVEVRANDNRPHTTDEFIFWPSCAEIEQVGDGQEDRGIVAATRTVFREVAEAGGQAIASCDFEDEVSAPG
jgi:hypothetical protein